MNPETQAIQSTANADAELQAPEANPQVPVTKEPNPPDITDDTMLEMEGEIVKERAKSELEQLNQIGPSPEQIKAWKAEHKKIYGSIIGQIYFVYRGILRPEYQAVLAQTARDQEFDGEIAIVDSCVLWPEEPPDLEAKEGVIPTLAGKIVEAAGFEPTAEIIEL